MTLTEILMSVGALAAAVGLAYIGVRLAQGPNPPKRRLSYNRGCFDCEWDRIVTKDGAAYWTCVRRCERHR